MGWLDEWLSGPKEAPSIEVPAARNGVAREAMPTAKPEPVEIREVWFQIRPCHNGDLGAVEAAFYSVSNGVLTMRDEKGAPTGKQCRLGPKDDPARVAATMGRQAWAAKVPTSDFNRPLDYGQQWMA